MKVILFSPAGIIVLAAFVLSAFFIYWFIIRQKMLMKKLNRELDLIRLEVSTLPYFGWIMYKCLGIYDRVYKCKPYFKLNSKNRNKVYTSCNSLKNELWKQALQELRSMKVFVGVTKEKGAVLHKFYEYEHQYSFFTQFTYAFQRKVEYCFVKENITDVITYYGFELLRTDFNRALKEEGIGEHLESIIRNTTDWRTKAGDNIGDPLQTIWRALETYITDLVLLKKKTIEERLSTGERMADKLCLGKDYPQGLQIFESLLKSSLRRFSFLQKHFDSIELNYNQVLIRIIGKDGNEQNRKFLSEKLTLEAYKKQLCTVVQP